MPAQRRHRLEARHPALVLADIAEAHLSRGTRSGSGAGMAASAILSASAPGYLKSRAGTLI